VLRPSAAFDANSLHPPTRSLAITDVVFSMRGVMMLLFSCPSPIEKLPFVANPLMPKNSILSMMALAGTRERFWSVVIFLLVVDAVLTSDTDPVALRGVKHCTDTRLPEDALRVTPEAPATGIMTCSLLQHFPQATRTWFLLFITLEFIPNEDCLNMIFHTNLST